MQSVQRPNQLVVESETLSIMALMAALRRPKRCVGAIARERSLTTPMHTNRRELLV
ncbi:MAG: hypothetical protein HC840_08035 [Leptolyngbyaceae cyanobacterium RM2_2_4]|nr:hypothetical protein [Leptolyngbyaceae cyanobacterium RM2_2_4]